VSGPGVVGARQPVGSIKKMRRPALWNQWCGFTPVYALLGRFLPRLKAALGRPPFFAMTVQVGPSATRRPPSLDSGAKRNAVKRSGFEHPFQARQVGLGMVS
jgi:hypothetical protein